MADTAVVTAGGGTATSNAHTFGVNSVSAVLIARGNNGGTPAAGDTLTIKILETVGDTKAQPDVSDDFTTVDNAVPVAVLDTNASNPSVSQGVGIYGENKAIQMHAINDASANSITVSGQIVELDKDGNKTTSQIDWP